MTTRKVKLELVGLNGNSFALMGAFQRAAKQQGWTRDEVNAVLDQCKAGDYDHLLNVLVENTESPDGDGDEETDGAARRDVL